MKAGAVTPATELIALEQDPLNSPSMLAKPQVTVYNEGLADAPPAVCWRWCAGWLSVQSTHQRGLIVPGSGHFL